MVKHVFHHVPGRQCGWRGGVLDEVAVDMMSHPSGKSVKLPLLHYL